jgi:excisionase family DNA binding protein
MSIKLGKTKGHMKTDHFYTVRILAEKLSVKPLTIYRLIANGKLPALKIGRSIRFDPADIDAYLKTVRIKPKGLKDKKDARRKNLR